MFTQNTFGKMIEKQLKNVFEQFQHQAKFKSYKELASGHINTTYLIKTHDKPYYVIQCLNDDVFTDVPGLIGNKVAISEHIQNKFKSTSPDVSASKVLTFLKTKTNQSYVKDTNGNYWNLMYYIDNSITHEVVTNKSIAHEAGLLMGEFLIMTEDFEADKLVEVIPKFHDMSYRFRQFEEALQHAEKERFSNSEKFINLVKNLKNEMHILQQLKDAGKFKMRVTHNDTKISNMLFDTKNQGICVIDTDTVMPGIIHYDFGDAIRTICNTAAEDETNLDRVEFNVSFYEAYTKGFLKKMKSSLSALELQHLPLAVKTMIFIMGLRFLTDYLNGDIYYKTNYEQHNLDRAKNQFKLLESFTSQTPSISHLLE